MNIKPMLKRIVLLVIPLIINTYIVLAQSNVLPNIIPPSPNAQSFIKYGEYPVSNYTGVPDISIPIHIINLKDLTIPISLTYNASGIKVEEEAGRTGLGWDLNAGGVITHTIRGGNDFFEKHYFNSPPENNLNDIKAKEFTNYVITHKYGYYCYNTCEHAGSSSLCMDPRDLRCNVAYDFSYKPLPFQYEYPQNYNEFILGMTCLNNFDNEKGTSQYDFMGKDFEPDIFNYNFMGYSGKFIFTRTGEVIKEKEDNLNIIPTIDNKIYGPKSLKSWKIITPDGTKYYFEQTEQNKIDGTPVAEFIYYSSFYLTKIETINGTVVNFSYLKTKQTVNKYHRTQNSSLNQDISFFNMFYETVYLDKITYPNGSLNFEYTFDRTDCSPEPKLVSVTINEPVSSKWKFIYDYFNSNYKDNDIPTLERIKSIIGNNANYYDDSWNKTRLKLKEIRKIDLSDKLEQSYKFSYNETRLPTKLSASMDHWGYYNGANNVTLIPRVVRNNSQKDGIIDVTTSGFNANREPVENLNEAFILNEITYPTGGKTEFKYETNKYKTNNLENDPYKYDYFYKEELILLEEPYVWNNVPTYYRHEVPITITNDGTGQKSKIYIKINLELGEYYKTWKEIDKTLYFRIRGAKDTTNIIWKFDYGAPRSPLPSEYNDKTKYFEKVWTDVEIPPGNYNIVVYGPMRKVMQSTRVEVKKVIYPKEFLESQPYKLGGGLRIKKIISKDQNNNVLLSKSFRYTLDGSSNEVQTSGKLMFYPRYNNDPVYTGTSGLRTGTGYSVGYSQVQVFNEDSNGIMSGKSIFTYINKPDKNLNYTYDMNNMSTQYLSVFYDAGKDINPLGIGSYSYSENGTLLKESIYKRTETSQIKLIKETEYANKIIENDIYWAIYKSKFTVLSGYPIGIPNGDLFKDNRGQDVTRLNFIYPAIRPIWVKMTQKKETFYDGISPFEITTDYEYNEKYHSLITEKMFSSDGNKVTTEYKYPFDRNDKTIYKTLVTDNRISEPVEVKKLVGELVAFQKVNNHNYFNGNINLSTILTNTANNYALETKLQYFNYDSYGNPVYLKTNDETSIIYLWSYSGQFPIAEIKNADFVTVEAAVKSVFGTAMTIDALSKTITPNETKLKDGSLQKALPCTLVTTYTYRPLTGMLTSTDPSGLTTYYDYDTFGRLKETYILENGIKKVLQSYNYHYQNQ